MNQLKNIINEVLQEKVFNSEKDIGNLPFLGKNATVWRDNTLSQLISKYGEEPNTEQENLFLKNLQTFFTRNKWVDIEKSDLELLLSYKSKFPGVLDPSVSSKLVYRGATIDASYFQRKDCKISKVSSSLFKVTFSQYPKINSRGETSPGLSFSTDSKTAITFMEEKFLTIEKLIDEGRIPCVYILKSNNPQLIFNPEFIKDISIFDDESEVILVGNNFTPDGIIIPFIPQKYSKDSNESIKYLIQKQQLSLEK